VVIVWRAWTICVRRRLPVAVSIFLLVASLGRNRPVVAVVLLNIHPTSNALAISPRKYRTAVENTTEIAITGIAALACSISANGLATATIGIQAL
jgi:hypothetical protein